MADGNNELESRVSRVQGIWNHIENICIEPKNLKLRPSKFKGKVDWNYETQIKTTETELKTSDLNYKL